MQEKVVMMSPSELIPYENNPRNNDGAVDAVAKSIQEFGFRSPIIVDKNKVIIAGHTRLKASLKLGLKEVPVIVADDLTEEQAKALRLVDNKTNELASWDLEKLKVEIDDVDISLGDFGFTESPEIDWETSEDISEDNYHEPDKVLLQCPACNHVDSKERFVRVNNHQ